MANSPLVAIGTNKESPQNDRINGNPQITYFKQNIKTHTLFAVDIVSQEFQSNVGFGRTSTVSIPRAADLLWKCHLDIKLPELTFSGAGGAWTDYVGLALLEKLEMQVGPTTFDTHTGQWMYIWSELTMTEGKRSSFLKQIGQRPELTTVANTIEAATIKVPLFFWFCRKPSMALPLAALDFADTKLKVTFSKLTEIIINPGNLVGNATSYTLDASLYTNYIHLDADEHISLTAEPMNIVFEQLQYIETSFSANQDGRVQLQLSHPVKFLAWTNQKQSNLDANRVFDFTTSGSSGTPYAGKNPLQSATLGIYSNKMFESMDAMYFNHVVPYDFFERDPAEGINVMSFALMPADNQPTGTLNFSKVEQSNLTQVMFDKSEPYKTVVYSWAYNTMVISDGSAGLEFAS